MNAKKYVLNEYTPCNRRIFHFFAFLRSRTLTQIFFQKADFCTKILQPVRFWMIFFSKRHILKQRFLNMPDSNTEILQLVRFCLNFFSKDRIWISNKNVHLKNHVWIYKITWRNFAFLVHFKKHDPDAKFFFKKTDFWTKISKHLRF